MSPFVSEDPIKEVVAPFAAAQQGVVSQAALLLHADLLEDACRGPVVGVAGGGDAVQVEVLEAEQPIKTFTTELEEGLTVTIELPNVHRYALDEKLILPNGGTGLFAVRRESGTHIVFLARVTTRD